MSKIGKKLIIVPDGVQVSVTDGIIKVKGLSAELTQKLHPKVRVEITGPEVKVTVKNTDDKRQKALWGTFRSLLANMIIGVSRGFEKKLEIVGVGYKAQVNSGKLVMALGFSHPTIMEIPKGLEVKVEKNTLIVSGADKQLVGEFSAHIRSHRVPEPYKGKGIKYSDEVVRRKAGKVVKAVGG
ncbi:MAG: 50S ribosomal protein L6 [bacterium]|nr:50S ribosomal protein L6 [bacterium]